MTFVNFLYYTKKLGKLILVNVFHSILATLSKKLLSKSPSWFYVGIKFGQEKYNYDYNFIVVLNSALEYKINN